MDRRTIENPFLTRDVFLVRCPSPHGPSVLPLLRLMRLGAWRSLSIFCAFFLMRLPCSLSFSFSCLHRCSSGFHGCVPRRQLSLPPPTLSHRPAPQSAPVGVLPTPPQAGVVGGSPAFQPGEPSGWGGRSLLGRLHGLEVLGCRWYCIALTFHCLLI